MILKQQFSEIEQLPTPSRLKLLSLEDKFDALKKAEQIFSEISDNYETPLTDIRTPKAYRNFLAQNKVLAHDEGIRARDVMRNAALLKDYVGRFGMLPNQLNGESQLHLRESLEASIFQMKTGIRAEVSLSDDNKQGLLSISKGNVTMDIPFYIAYAHANAFDVEDNRIDIKVGSLQISPELQPKFPRLANAMNEILIADTPDQMGLVIDADFTLQAREVDDMLFVNNLSNNTGVIKEVSGYLDKQQLRREASMSATLDNNNQLG